MARSSAVIPPTAGSPAASLRRLHLACALVSALVGFGLYASLYDGKFYWDDNILIVDNDQALDEWGDALRAFAQPVFPEEAVAYYRPILMASFVIERQLWGKNPGAFHVTNAVIHGLNAAIVWLYLFILVESPAAALAGALLFAVHPIQGQSVGLIPARNDMMLVLPVIGMLLADRARQQRPAGEGWPFAVAIVGCYALTVWNKETGIVAPALLILDDLLLRRRRPADLVARIPLLAALAAVVLAYFATRHVIFGTPFGGDEYGNPPLGHRLEVVIVTLGYYVRQILLPWGFAPTPYHPGLLDLAGAAFWKLAFFFALFVLASALAVGWNRRAAFGLAFFLVTVFPVLGLAPMKLYLLEHRVYLPMVGIALAAAATLAYAASRSRAALPAGFAVVAVLAILAWTRVPVFRDPVSFWTAGAANAPLSEYAHDELGYVLTQAGRDEDAMVAFRKALRIDPRLDSSRYKLALALERSGRPGEAIAEIEELLRQHPRSVAAWNVLGVLRKRSGDLEGARAALGHGLEIAPEDPALLANLANVHEDLGAHDEAVDMLRTLVRVEPGATAAWQQLGRQLYNARRYGEAVDAFRRALSLGAADALVRVDLAYALLRSGKRDEAVAEARLALEKSGGAPEVARRLESVGLLEAARANGP